MAATGTESVSLEQLRTWSIEVDGKIENKVTEPSTSPTAGQVLSYNGENNVWVTPSEGTVYTGTAPIVVDESVISATEATQSAAGTMSALDKTKLDGVEAGANKYVLPSASAGALGGITVVETDRPGNLVSITKGEANSFGVQYGNGLTKSGNAIAVENPVPDGGTAGQVLTKTADGTEWADAQGGEEYVLPLASHSALGGIKGDSFAATGGDDPYAEVQIYNPTEKAVVGAATDTVYGVVKFASDADFAAYMGITQSSGGTGPVN